MIVKTIREHANASPPTYTKEVGQEYIVSDGMAANLIAAGIVEECKPRRTRKRAGDETNAED